MSYTDGSKTITGKSTTTLQDGTRPTLKITTTATNGFLHSTSISENYTAVYATDVSGNKNTGASYLNSVLTRTSYNSSIGMFLNGYSASSTYLYTARFIFDFTEARKLTLNMRVSYNPTSVDGYFYGSDDGTTWTEIGTIDNATSETITSNTAYRYYKVEAKSIKMMSIYYMYFTNVDDWN